MNKKDCTNYKTRITDVNEFKRVLNSCNSCIKFVLSPFTITCNGFLVKNWDSIMLIVK